MGVDDPIFKGNAGYGTDARAKGDFGTDMFKNDNKIGPQQTKVNMNKTSGKAGKGK